MSSKFNHEQNEHEPYPWLEEKVYAKLRQRTIDLVKRSVDALLKDKQRVSLSTVAAKSREFDEKGISESAILDNQEARAYYEQHRSWLGSLRKRAQSLVVTSPTSPKVVKPGRDEQRVRQRYLRMSKEALVERLIIAERALTEQRERWLGQQDEALTWRLRAEAAEARLTQEREVSPRATRTRPANEK
ncbi:hypothetical protein ccbrp13_24300 [Ktedonobacteria bacterium brp13]|nr:hypothetical protein ccbrp13_24300 [Ktedonobacteria bacterium brp13]